MRRDAEKHARESEFCTLFSERAREREKVSSLYFAPHIDSMHINVIKLHTEVCPKLETSYKIGDFLKSEKLEREIISLALTQRWYDLRSFSSNESLDGKYGLNPVAWNSVPIAYFLNWIKAYEESHLIHSNLHFFKVMQFEWFFENPSENINILRCWMRLNKEYSNKCTQKILFFCRETTGLYNFS